MMMIIMMMMMSWFLGFIKTHLIFSWVFFFFVVVVVVVVMYFVQIEILTWFVASFFQLWERERESVSFFCLILGLQTPESTHGKERCSLLTGNCNKLFFTHQFGFHLTIQYHRNYLSHEVPTVLIGSGISPRQNKWWRNSFRNRFLMQTMRQALNMLRQSPPHWHSQSS